MADTFVHVDNINLSILRGAFVVLLVPSGCANSTTLQLLSMLELPDEGSMSIDGRDVAQTG